METNERKQREESKGKENKERERKIRERVSRKILPTDGAKGFNIGGEGPRFDSTDARSLSAGNTFRRLDLLRV